MTETNDGGFWIEGKPLHGWTCDCGAADCQEPNREFVPDVGEHCTCTLYLPEDPGCPEHGWWPLEA